MFLKCLRRVLITCISYYIQNENVQRAATSERMILDVRRPDCRTPMKALVAKTFKFVDTIWLQYLQRHLQDHRYAILSVETNVFLLLKYGRPLEDDSAMTVEEMDEDVEEDGEALDEDDEELDGDEED